MVYLNYFENEHSIFNQVEVTNLTCQSTKVKLIGHPIFWIQGKHFSKQKLKRRWSSQQGHNISRLLLLFGTFLKVKATKFENG